jgi:DNA-binding NarL/FixJ family response regulator
MRVLLVDDQSVVRDTLRSILRPYSEVDIVGEATDGEEAVVKVAQLQPDVVIMDIVMPRLDGIAAARQIHTVSPQTPIVGLSLHAKSYEVNAMVQAGAFEVISKERAIDDLYDAIQRAITVPQRDVTIKDTSDPMKPPQGNAEDTPSISQGVA